MKLFLPFGKIYETTGYVEIKLDLEKAYRLEWDLLRNVFRIQIFLIGGLIG